MRTGGYTLHQSLTPEAVGTVTQAVSLARRQGHAQVTPLHVARAMLASSTGLLRKACLQSHSHPLQCKALELCFNVALNRLPTSASTSILGPHSHHHHRYPSLSNALVAAFKRAQAHQRRGSIENQQQPILALKVETEQLIISILDDPSVSRVMREAGFSSTQVKANVEQAVSLEICSQSPVHSLSQSKESPKSPVFTTNLSQFPPTSHFRSTPTKPADNKIWIDDDVTSVLDAMMMKNKERKNIVIVGESLARAERVLRGVMDKFEKGDVSGDLRYVQFISLPLCSFLKNQLSEKMVRQKLGELWSSVRSYAGRGVVLNLGDLNWVLRSNYSHEQSKNSYCSVELVIMELSRLLSTTRDSGRLRIMGIATCETYMRCKTGQPSLETLWELYPLTLPVGSLGLSLNLESELQDELRSKVSRNGSGSSFLKAGVKQQLTCCSDCSANFNREVLSIATTTAHNHESTLPSWLQRYKEENRRQSIDDQQEFEKIRDLCNKWNSICSSVHKQAHFLEKALNFSSSSPSFSNSVPSYRQHSTLPGWPPTFERNRSPKEHQFLVSDQNGGEGFGPNLKMYLPITTNGTKPDLLSNPNSSPNSASSSEVMEDIEYLNKFKELNSENLKILCNALEKKVPWQEDIIPEIASTVLQCRSGMMRRKEKLKYREAKEETWLFFSGVDHEGKEKIARELAKLVFGSQCNFFKIGLSSFSLTRADSTEESSNKRARDELGSSYLERFGEAVEDNPSRVFFMEDVEQVDYHSQMGIKKAIESGQIALANGELVSLKDAIVIFNCESFSSMSRACSPPLRRKSGENEEKEDDEVKERKVCGVSLDLNVATGDNNGNEHTIADIGILEWVDRQIIFKNQVL